MSRQRGAGTGASNLRRSSLLDHNPGEKTKGRKTKQYRRGETATWKISDVDEVKYVTEGAEEYIDPKHKFEENRDMKFYDRKREILCENAVLKFDRLASERYGSLDKLFSKVRALSTLLQCLPLLC
jgi:hypothetical protein